MNPQPNWMPGGPAAVMTGAVDLDGIDGGGEGSDWQDGWYEGFFLATRSFTSKDGTARHFLSGDIPSKDGASRNIRLEVEVTRKTDGRTMNLTMLLNYRYEDLDTSTIQAVKEGKAETRTKLSLQRLAQLQTIAACGPLMPDGQGGIELGALYGKTAYFRLGQDSRKPTYKEIKACQLEAPKRAAVL